MDEEPVAPGPAPENPRASSAGRGGWSELLHNPRFLLLEASGALSSAGYAIYAVTVLYLAFGLTGNLLLAGLVLFLEYGIYTLTFLFAPLVDRAKDKRTILLVCFPIQAATAALLAGELAHGTLTTPVLLGAVAVLAIFWDLAWAVYMIAPRIVVGTDRLFAAGGVSSALGVGTRIAGYAGGGALVYFVGPPGGAATYAILLLLAAVVTVPLSLRGATAPEEPFGRAFARGWAAFRGRVGRPLRQFAALEVVYGFFVALPPLLVTLIAYERFPDPSAAYGLLVAVYVLGGAAAGIVVGHYNPRRSVGLLIVLAPVLAGAATLALLAVPADLVLIAGLFALVDAALSARHEAKYAWVQAVFPPDQLGRAVSNIYLFTGLSSSIAALTIGLLSAVLGPAGVVATAGVGFLAAAALAASIPFVRRMRF